MARTKKSNLRSNEPVKKLYPEASIQAIANAIREKSGSSDTFTVDQMATAIADIPTGGLEESDVNFFDYDGTLVASYTKQEFANLTAMPENPVHEGLTAQGWNWSLADAKTHVATYDFLDIGQMYVTTSGKTEIDVELYNEILLLHCHFGLAGTATIDWGDGTTPDVASGVSYSSVNVKLEHSYEVPGNYTISITLGENSYLGIFGETNDTYKGTYLIHYPSNNTTKQNIKLKYSMSIKSIRLGNNVLIGHDAFSDARNLKSITISSGTSFDGDNVFDTCEHLEFIVLPSGVSEIGTRFFNNSINLKHVSLPKTFLLTNQRVFSGCKTLKRVSAITGISSIPAYTFYSCQCLEKITELPNVTEINNYSFYGCSSLTRLPFSIASVTSIGNYAFSGCDYIYEDLQLPNTLASLGQSAFSGDYSLKSLTIPNTITSILDSTFYRCLSLVSITVPSSVTKIEGNGFGYCTSMKEYHFLSVEPPTITSSTFTDIQSNCIIYVPQESVDAYKAAQYWSSSLLKSKIQGE